MALGETLAGVASLGALWWLRNKLFSPSVGQYHKAREELAKLLREQPTAKGLNRKYIDSELAKLKKKYPYLDPVDDTPISLQFSFDDQEEDYPESNFKWVKVRGARKIIKKWLGRRGGGVCLVRVDKVARLLMHKPGFDGRFLQYSESVDGQQIAAFRIPRHELDVAIEHFLRDALSEEGVQLMPN